MRRCKTAYSTFLANAVLLLLAVGAVASESVSTPTPTPTIAAGGGDCFGDCDDDGIVAVNELVVLVTIALGGTPSAACSSLAPGSAVPTIGDLVRAVTGLLNGCDATPLPTEPAPAQALTADRILRIEFATTPPFVESPPNVLVAFLGTVERVAPYNRVTGALYDGDVLLGVSTSPEGCCATGIYSFHPVPVTWKAPGSPWDFPAGSPAIVDFTALHDGSIDGRIDVVIDAGRFDLDLASVGLRFIHATYANGGSTIPPAPVVRSVRIIDAPPVTPAPTLTVTPTAASTATGAATPTAASTPTTEPDDDDLATAPPAEAGLAA
jgi:hypothetical protein